MRKIKIVAEMIVVCEQTSRDSQDQGKKTAEVIAACEPGSLRSQNQEKNLSNCMNCVCMTPVNTSSIVRSWNESSFRLTKCRR